MLIKFRRKSVLLLLLFLFVVYLTLSLKKNISVPSSEASQRKGPRGSVRDGKGFVHCENVQYYCSSHSDINIAIVGEFASKSVVFCSDGHNVGVISIPNLSTFFHVIEIPSHHSLVSQASGGDKDDANAQNLNFKTFIKSYGADNLFKLSDFLDASSDSSYFVVLAYTGIELPASELNHEVVRLFSSQIFSRMKPGNLYFGLYDKKNNKLLAEMSTNVLDKLLRSFCLTNHSGTTTPLGKTPKVAAGKQSSGGAIISAVATGRQCVVESAKNEEPLVIGCDSDHVPVNLYSTSNGDSFPNYCVNGEVIKYTGVSKKIGRGLHLVVFTENWKFLSYEVYDTYEKMSDSDSLYKALISIPPKSILMLATHDEASNKLSENVKGILFRLGSSAVARMKYRDSWVFIGQKGLKGKTLFEHLVPKKASESYAGVAAIQKCVPKQLPVKQWISSLNDNLALFCEAQVSGYTSVCERNMSFPSDAHQEIAPEGWDVFSETSPLLVIPDLAKYDSHILLFRTLESIAQQPFLRPEMVYVALCKNDFILEFTEIVEIFGFNQMTFDYRKTQCFEVPYKDAFGRLFENKQFKQTIVIGAEVILEPDFLHFIFSTSPLLNSLNTDVISISGWNPNSFEGTNFPKNSLLRMSEFPLYGWVLTREIRDELTKTKDSFKDCCTDRKWYEGWTKPRDKGVVVVPGLSRVKLARVPEAFDIDTIKLMLYRNRRLSSSIVKKPLSISFPLENVASLDAYRYFLESTFAGCKQVDILTQSSVEQLEKSWNKTIGDTRTPRSKLLNFSQEKRGFENATDDLTFEQKSGCVVVKVDRLKKDSLNELIIKSLLRFFNLAHTEPFGYYDGAIFTFRNAVPVLLVERQAPILELLQ